MGSGDPRDGSNLVLSQPLAASGLWPITKHLLPSVPNTYQSHSRGMSDTSVIELAARVMNIACGASEGLPLDKLLLALQRSPLA